MKNTHGHTVIELLIVVAVLMLLAAIVLPSASADTDRKLDTLQLEIQDALDHAQSLSYHTGSPHGVRFHTSGQWFAVINEVGIPADDPLSHGDYVVRLKDPGQPKGIALDYADFAGRPLAAFDEKGVLHTSGQVHISTNADERWFVVTTANHQLIEIPVSK